MGNELVDFRHKQNGSACISLLFFGVGEGTGARRGGAWSIL
jgi:hypothetical protein